MHCSDSTVGDGDQGDVHINKKFKMLGASELGVEKSCGMLGLNMTDGLEVFAHIASLQATWSAVDCSDGPG